MISDYRCFFCFTRAFEKLLEKENISNEAKASFTLDMISLFQNNSDDFSAPLFSMKLHKILRGYTHNPDPYKMEKKENNDQAMNLIYEFAKLIKQSDDTFSTSLKIAIAGNIIDFAANDNFNILVTIDKALSSEFALDHSKQLKKAIENAESVLYLGDNAGEIVFDRLFIETINHPNLTYVVRGGPVINDATMEDASYVGMNDIANVISSGFDAPSTIPEKSSKEFQLYFQKADLIISKGQGNLEGLFPLNDDRIFFLLMVKCDVISEFLKVRKDSLIVYNASF
ncbi:MAG: DUF89 family protein [Bacteroidales bacterium]|nr:DUF89 family protein [Bacteroidales bacterium]